MNESFETLGVLIDEIDNLTHALSLPIPDKMHVESLRAALPKKVESLKKVFIEITGENPWE